MRKKLLLFKLLLLFGSPFAMGQTFVAVDSVNNNPKGISPDGKYIVGIDTDFRNNGYKSFLWDLENSSFQWVTDTETEDLSITNNGSFTAISNTGLVVGHFFNSVRRGAVATIWKNGERIHLGFGSLEETEGVTSYALCVSSDGNIVGGYMNEDLGGGLSRHIPCIWNYQESTDTWEITELTITDRISRVTGISRDGRVMIGSPLNLSDGYFYKPVIWIDGVLKELEIMGHCRSISENGNYIVIQTSMNDAVLYSVEEDTITPINLEFENYYNITTIQVANNMDIYGTLEYVDAEYMQKNSYFRSFYYNPTSWTGWPICIDFDYFIRLLDDEMTLPEGLTFLYEKEPNVRVNSVSADGSVIVGAAHINGTEATWVLDTQHKEFMVLENINPLTALVTNQQEVTLEWTTIYPGGVHEIVHYRLYRDGEIIYDGGEGVEEIEETTHNRYRFVDKDVPAGYRNYAVSAMCKKFGGIIPPGIGRTNVLDEEEEKLLETPKSEITEVAVADHFNLPFFDDFESASRKTNYWTTGKHPDKWWHFNKYMGVNGQNSLTSSHTDEKKTSSILSRHMDATQLEKVYLSYAKLFLEIVVGTPEGVLPNTGISWLDIEVSTDGTTWRRVKRYTSDIELKTKTYGYVHEVIDISDWVAGEIFQIKLTIDGEEDSYYEWHIDWFSVTDHVEKSPAIHLKGYVKDDQVKLFWSNSIGNYELTHMVSQSGSFLGSYTVPIAHEGKKGEELIIANGFDNYDLYVFDGMYLTSVTAYLLGDVNSALELVVFENDKEIRRQAIRSIIPDSENTFVLKEPVQIDKNKHLKYGLRVTENDAEFIFRYQMTDEAITGKSDLYSSDNGKTWTTIYDTFPEEKRNGAWHLTANLTETPEANVKERDENLISYYVYRDGELINDKFYSYHLTQTNDKKENDGCYRVMAYYADGTFSEFSNSVCIDDMDDITGQYVAIEENVIEKNKIGFYPNPASDIVYLTSSAKKVTVLNLDGQTLLISEKNEIDVTNLPEGVYFIQMETSDEMVETEKLIIKK